MRYERSIGSQNYSHRHDVWYIVKAYKGVVAAQIIA